MRGYELVRALREDAQDCAREDRQALLFDAAAEIENLLYEIKTLREASLGLGKD